MTWLRVFIHRLRGLFLKRRMEQELEEEIRTHLEMQIEDNLRQGMSVAEARAAATRKFGGVEQVKERYRERRGLPVVEATLQDLRFGLRMLRKHKGFTAVVVLSLALGIGANTAIFSLVDVVLLRSLPVRDPAALVQFKWAAGNSFRVRYDGYADRDELPGLRVMTSFTHPTFLHLQSQQRTLSDLFAFATVDQLNVNWNGQSEIARGLVASGNYHSALGVTPLLGRLLSPADDKPDAPMVAVLSAQYWERRFGGEPTIVGEQINVNNAAFTVIGVTSPTFNGTASNALAPDVTVALAQEPQVRAGNSALREQSLWWLMVLGRMKPGVTREQVQAELATAFQQRALAERTTPQNTGQAVSPAATEMPRLLIAPGRRGDTNWARYYKRSLYLLWAVGGLVLLLACANVATLLLARARARLKEIALRLALGAGRGRLLRQLLTESALLALAGGAVGILLAQWGRDLLLRLQFSGQELTGLQAGLASLDGRLLGFNLTVSLLTGLLFGLAPAWQALRIDLIPALKDTGRNSGGQARSRLSRTLVVAQVALSLLLLVGAGLFLRTLRNLHQVDIGFKAQNLLLFRVDPRLSGYKNEQIKALYQRLFARLEAVPGVHAVTFSRHPLLAGSRGVRPFFVTRKNAAPSEPSSAHVHIVRANFLEAMNIPILSGRGLREQDDAQGPPVAVVNQTLARRLFPNQNPMGQRFGFSAEKAGQIEIVGVAQDAKYDSLRDDTPATVYIPWLQEPGVGQMNFEVRTAGAPAAALSAVRQAVREVDGNLPLFDVKTQAEQATQALAQERLFASLLSFFGLLALLLAALGIYGVMAHSVTQRTQEMGVRIALGAQPRDVLRLVLGQGMWLVIPGVVIGVASAYAATRLLTSFLYGVGAMDGLTFSLIVLLLLAVALLACWIPARRAGKVDPLVALRHE
jgi:predicted permease